MAIEQAVVQPIKVLDGAWSHCACKGEHPQQTGNFSFIIEGELPFQMILPYATHFIKPLHCGVLVPGNKWVFVQLWNVPTRDGNGVLHSPTDLTVEVQRDPDLSDIQLCSEAHWDGNLSNIAGKDTATIIVIFTDHMGTVVPQLKHKGCWMYRSHTVVEFSGETPTFQ